MRTKGYARSHDTIFFYTKSTVFIWNQLYKEYSSAQLSRYKKGPDGRYYTGQDLTIYGNTKRNFEWRGARPPEHRGWAVSAEQLETWWNEGKILKKRDGSPRLDGLKVYLDEKPGKVIDTIWTDIDRVGNTSAERLGYPTQKPVALLERIIKASSNPGDVVLDPFCGCGTALHAAQKLGRRWIGIDITHLAISLIEKRLREAFPDVEYETFGTPKDLSGAQDLFHRDPYQFQWWACSLVNAQPYKGKKKGADGGIDGVIYVQDEADASASKRILVSVKGGARVDVKMIREFIQVVEKNDAVIGLFVTLTPPKKTMIREAAAAGFYHCPFNQKDYPRLQILSVEGLLSGRERPQYLDLSAGTATFKQAPREKGPRQNQGTLL